MPKMGVDPNEVKAPVPVPGNQWYKLKVKEIKAQKGKKDANTVNLNVKTEVVESGNSEYNGKVIFILLAQKFARAWPDFAHGCGFPLQPDGQLPGDWIFDTAEPDNVEKAQYKGPLLGRILEAEVIVDNYNGNENNKVKQIRCKLPDCATKFPDIKHLTNLVGKK